MASNIHEIENTLAELLRKPGIKAYAFFSPEAIPIKSANIDETTVVQYSALVADLMSRTKSNMKRLLPAPDCDLQSVRIRTQKGTEMIITTVNDYTMLAIQQVDPEKVLEEKEEQPAS